MNIAITTETASDMPTDLLKKYNVKTVPFGVTIGDEFFYDGDISIDEIFAKAKHAKCITIEHGTSHLSVHSRFWDSIGSVYEHVLTKIDQLFCHDYYGVSEACNEWLKHFHIKAKVY